MGQKFSSRRTRQVYEFIRAHRHQFDIRQTCRVLEVTHSGYYAWLKHPQSARATENARLLKLIRASFNASNGIYGSPRVFLDLREAGETCSKHRVARLMRANNIRPVRGYSRKPKAGARQSGFVPNVLQRQFDVGRPNRAWVTDITYIRTWEGWLYLAVVMDLFSRKIVGWAVAATIGRGLVLDAVLMAVRRRRPKNAVIHSDQGSQYGSDDWLRFCRTNGLTPRMSRRGNCWDNAVAESFFSSLKKEHIKKKIYKNRSIAREAIAEYIDAFYNPTRRHSHLGGVSPVAFEAAGSRR
ncbi:MAG: IS3 family transposase [Steroidobacteraceae bacterium]